MESHRKQGRHAPGMEKDVAKKRKSGGENGRDCPRRKKRIRVGKKGGELNDIRSILGFNL